MAANRPVTARGCALGCGLWLLLLLLPALAFWLYAQREIVWARGPGGLVQDKVFYVDQPDAAGLGYLSARLAAEPAAAGPVCVRTRVVYWLWRTAETASPAADYCQCYTQAADVWELSAATCPGN